MGNTTSTGTNPSSQTSAQSSFHGRHTLDEHGRKSGPSRRNLTARQSWPNLQSLDYHNNANLRSNLTGMRPIRFHQVHGQNIVLSRDCMTVTRQGSFCNAVVFSSRHIRQREPFSVRLQQCTTRGWSGVLRFGYTIHCPDRLRSATLPKYVCPDMTVKPGNWAKALKESSVHNNDVLTFFYNRKGEVYLSVNKGPFNLFFNGIDVTKQLWGLIDVYGNTTGVTVEADYDIVIPNERQLQAMSSIPENAPTNPEPPSELLLLPRGGAEGRSLPTSSPVATTNSYAPLPFHELAHGHNIIFREHSLVAERRQDSYSGGLVFISRPLKVGEEFAIDIVGVSSRYIGNLGVGVTACDPDKLVDEVLPSESESLVDRPEYWVVTKELEVPQAGGEIGFVINAQGQLHHVGGDGTSKGILMHVDTSVPLWLFLDVYGATQAIRSKGIKLHPRDAFFVEGNVEIGSNTHSAMPLLPGPSCETASAPEPCVVIDGPDKAEAATVRPQKARAKPPPRPSHPPKFHAKPKDDECKICMERSTTTVFYKCGHSCTCEECGMKLKGKQCPLCRAEVVDVIKLFRS